MTHQVSVRVDTNANGEVIRSNKDIYEYVVYIIIRIYYKQFLNNFEGTVGAN